MTTLASKVLFLVVSLVVVQGCSIGGRLWAIPLGIVGAMVGCQIDGVKRNSAFEFPKSRKNSRQLGL